MNYLFKNIKFILEDVDELQALDDHNTSPEQIRNIYNNADVDGNFFKKMDKIIRHPQTPPEVIQNAFDRFHNGPAEKEFTSSFVNSLNASPEILIRSARKASAQDLEDLYNNPSFHLHLLENPGILQSQGRQKSTTHEGLMRMAMYPKTPPYVHENMLSSPVLHNSLISNPNLHPNLLRRLDQNADQYVQEGGDSYKHSQLANHPNLPTDLFEKYVGMLNNEPFYDKENKFFVETRPLSVLENKKTPKHVLNTFVNNFIDFKNKDTTSDNDYTFNPNMENIKHSNPFPYFIKNENLEPKQLHNLANAQIKSKNYQTLEDIANHPNTQPDTLHTLAKTINNDNEHSYNLGHALLNNPRLSTQSIHHISKSPLAKNNSDIVGKIVNHDNTSENTLKGIINDKNQFGQAKQMAEKRLKGEENV